MIPCFHCLDSSFVGLALLVWLCSHCLMHKLAEEPEPDKHAAHTSVQICGIFPRCKQLTASNEHMLLLLQLCHHNYWPKSVPPHRPYQSFPHEKTNQGTVSKVRRAGTFGGDTFKLNYRRCSPFFNELPACDSAVHFRYVSRDKVIPENSVIFPLR